MWWTTKEKWFKAEAQDFFSQTCIQHRSPPNLLFGGWQVLIPWGYSGWDVRLISLLHLTAEGRNAVLHIPYWAVPAHLWHPDWGSVSVSSFPFHFLPRCPLLIGHPGGEWGGDWVVLFSWVILIFGGFTLLVTSTSLRSNHPSGDRPALSSLGKRRECD